MEARKEMEKMFNPILYKTTEAQAKQLINSALDFVFRTSDGIIASGEQSYPGVTRKIYGLPEYQPNKDYLATTNEGFKEQKKTKKVENPKLESILHKKNRYQESESERQDREDEEDREDFREDYE
jgi:hypothetical protein